jgi:hypothetical protein
MEKCSNGQMPTEKNPPNRGDFFFYGAGVTARWPKVSNADPVARSCSTAAVRLYLRAAPSTALLQLGNAPRLIAGDSLLSTFVLQRWSS